MNIILKAIAYSKPRIIVISDTNIEILLLFFVDLVGPQHERHDVTNRLNLIFPWQEPLFCYLQFVVIFTLQNDTSISDKQNFLVIKYLYIFRHIIIMKTSVQGLFYNQAHLS